MDENPAGRDEPDAGNTGDGNQINDPLTQSEKDAPRPDFEPRKPA